MTPIVNNKPWSCIYGKFFADPSYGMSSFCAAPIQGRRGAILWIAPCLVQKFCLLHNVIGILYGPIKPAHTALATVADDDSSY